MDICRICLSNNINRDISQLQISKKDTQSYVNIILFCLDIQVTVDSAAGRKLCLKCFKKIIHFHKFKTLALKNDAYMKSLDPDADIKCEVYVRDNANIEESMNTGETLIPDETLNNNDCLSLKVKEEIDLKDEVEGLDYESDNEFLSVIKNIKYEYTEEAKENELAAPVRKRGRPKLPKTEEKEREVCEECGKAVRDLKQHTRLHLPVQDRKRYKCKLCDKEFSSCSARYKHNRVKHLCIKKKCDVCKKEVVNLRSHQLTMHNTAAMKFSCVSCSRRFLSQARLDAHATLHTNDRPFHCDVCDKQFRLKIVMLHHRRQVHEKEKTHLCQFCSKSFFKKYHLSVHLRKHTKEKPYPCAQCGKSFTSSSTLRGHRQTHSDVKEFHCQFCDSRFVKQEYLRAHMVCHTKEKRHPCKYCGVRFGRSDHRKRHEYTAHEKHLVTAYLRAHMICHTKEKRHPCKYCGMRFGRSDHCKRHEYTAHKKDLVTT